jgi:peptidoglycan/xylan/chitin deacetylase (PgdA/CDA1 family)
VKPNNWNDFPVGARLAKNWHTAMFHYVRPKFNGAGIAGVTVTEFNDLLARLEPLVEFVNPANLLSEATETAAESGLRPKVLMSFDDGLRDHFEFVAPVLEAHGIRGLFFVNSDQYELGRTLLIHRWHAIREAVPDLVHHPVFASVIGAAETRNSDIARAVRWDDGVMAAFKYSFNYGMGQQQKRVVVEALEGALSLSPPEIDEVYMSRVELVDLIKRGHQVCSHSHTHACLSLLDENDLKRDIASSIDFITSIGGDPRIFAYPFGKAESFNIRVREVLRDCGIRLAFSSEPRGGGQSVDPLALPRLDPRDLLDELDRWRVI